MNIIIETKPGQSQPTVHLYHSTANDIACMVSLAREHGVELEEDDYGDNDTEISNLINEVDEGLSGSGVAIHWLDQDPIDNEDGEFDNKV